MAISVKVKGLKSLERQLKKNASLSDVKSVVSKHGSQMQQKMVQNADFHGHYEWKKGKGKKFVKPTGATRRSIHGEGLPGRLRIRGRADYALLSVFGVWYSVYGVAAICKTGF